MSRPRLPLVLSALAWIGFNVVMAWMVVFLAGVLVPRTVDGPSRVSTPLAVTTDLVLLLLFGVQHSLMARPAAKAVLRRWVPARLERTTYVLATDVCLILLLVLWQPWGGEVWRVHGVAAALLWVLCTAGWALATAATYAVDHFELTGLRQAGWPAPGGRAAPGELEVRGLHALVRHPLMTGLLVAFWATPHMGAAHLLLAGALTGYVAIGIRFEERDLRRTFGTTYDAYAARVPALVPWKRLRRGPIIEMADGG